MYSIITNFSIIFKLYKVNNQQNLWLYFSDNFIKLMNNIIILSIVNDVIVLLST